MSDRITANQPYLITQPNARLEQHLFWLAEGLLLALLVMTATTVNAQSVVSGSVYRLKNQCSDKVLDVSDVSQLNGALVHQWTSVSEQKNQQWKIEATDSGYHRLIAQHSQKALDAYGAGINNSTPIVQWTPHNASNQQWKIVSTGDGYSKLEARHAAGKMLDVAESSTANGARVHLWQDNGTCAQRWKFELISRQPPIPSSGTGLTAEYFDYPYFSGSPLTRTDANINFDWGTGEPTGGIGQDTFSVRWTGEVETPTDGAYAFTTTSDDGVRLWVNNQLLIEQWNDHSPREDVGIISLEAGRKYALKVEYYENGGGALAKLEWQTPGAAAREVVPQGRLYPASVPPSSNDRWTERILNTDGTINWTGYDVVATHYDAPDVLEYRLGPSYDDYHTAPENIPTLWGSSQDGWSGGDRSCAVVNQCDDWFAMSGQMLFSPDNTASPEYQPGVARARNGSIYIKSDVNPRYILDMRVQWTPDAGNYYNTNPDPAVQSADWIRASGGSLPIPVASVRSKGNGGVTGFLLFKNGLIGATGTGNDPYQWFPARFPYVSVKLPDGLVPTAGTVTPSNEFLLVTVWNIREHKGQLAVIAIKGKVLAEGDSTDDNGHYQYGFPNWPHITGMKLLGLLDLPFAAPTSIAATTDLAINFGRGQTQNAGFDLSQQTERDTWYNWSQGSNLDHYKRTARSGYAVVASRAENKVTFVDLQPLFAYYRQMYFTSEANYIQTKNEGAPDNLWPFSFTYAPEQKPLIVQTINVAQPTAVATGTSRNTFRWRGGNSSKFEENAYVASMDGSVRIYKVGDLRTPYSSSALAVGNPFKTFQVGRNPTNIDYGAVASVGNELFFNSRGDRSISFVDEDGTVHGTLRDSRLKDPVYVTVSHNQRRGHWASILTVMDYRGKKVVNYRYAPDPYSEDVPVGQNGTSKFEFGFITLLPGKPFMYTLAEVI